jgi:hypothetical protein
VQACFSTHLSPSRLTMQYPVESIRIRTALQEIAQEIERRRVTVTTRLPTNQFPNGYQEVKQGEVVSLIGIQRSSNQVSRTGSFGN